MYTLLMRLGPFATLMTLVIFSLLAKPDRLRAAPTEPQPTLETTDEVKNQNDQSEDPQLLQVLDITQPAKKTTQQKRVERDVFFPYQSSISPRLGTGLKNVGSSSFYFLGVNYVRQPE
jgi:hypothetical protein